MPLFDMGAYETAQVTVGAPPLIIIHVWDGIAASVDGSTKLKAYKTLQEAVNIIPSTLANAYLIYVWEGTYGAGATIPAKVATDSLRITIKGHPNATTRPYFTPGAGIIINSEYVTIEGLEFETGITAAIDASGISGGAGIIITRNIIHNTLIGIKYGASIANYSVSIYNNLFYDNSEGIRIINSSTKPDVTLINNTFSDNAVGVSCLYTGSPGTEITSIDNIIVHSTLAGYSTASTTIVNSDYDCYYLNTNNISGGTLSEGFNNIKVDPEFKDRSGDDYQPALTSPCINTGDPNNTAGLTTDILGYTREVDRMDMGAYERQPIEYALYTSYTLLEELGYANIESITQYNERTQEWNWAGWDIDDLSYNTGTIATPSPIGDNFKILPHKKYWIRARQAVDDSVLGIIAKKNLDSEGTFGLSSGAIVSTFVLGHGNIGNAAVKGTGTKDDNSIAFANNSVFTSETPYQKDRISDTFNDETTVGTYAIDYKKGLMYLKADLNNDADATVSYNYLGDTLPMYDVSTEMVSTMPKAVNSLRVERISNNSTDVNLSWDAVTEDIYDNDVTISYYEIYRGAKSRFVPSKGTALYQHVSVFGIYSNDVAKFGQDVFGSITTGSLIATVTGTTYTDTDVLLNDDYNYFYLIRAVSADNVASDYSNAGYILKIDITNLSSVYLATPELTTMATASDVITTLNGSGSDPVAQVSVTDIIQNISYTYTATGTGTNFTLDPRFQIKVTFISSKTSTYIVWVGAHDGSYSAFRSALHNGAKEDDLKPFADTATIAT
jgi:hypothetical protein